jgi:hypothetical protein
MTNTCMTNACRASLEDMKACIEKGTKSGGKGPAAGIAFESIYGSRSASRAELRDETLRLLSLLLSRLHGSGLA